MRKSNLILGLILALSFCQISYAADDTNTLPISASIYSPASMGNGFYRPNWGYRGRRFNNGFNNRFNNPFWYPRRGTLTGFTPPIYPQNTYYNYSNYGYDPYSSYCYDGDGLIAKFNRFLNKKLNKINQTDPYYDPYVNGNYTGEQKQIQLFDMGQDGFYNGYTNGSMGTKSNATVTSID